MTSSIKESALQEAICNAFCGDLIVRSVPDGLAIGTGFKRENGDDIGFYVIQDKSHQGLYRLEDDGLTIPYLEGCGVDFSAETRKQAFAEILEQYRALYDEDSATIASLSVTKEELPRAALHFVALLLRMADFLLLTPDRVFSSFRED